MVNSVDTDLQATFTLVGLTPSTSLADTLSVGIEHDAQFLTVWRSSCMLQKYSLAGTGAQYPCQLEQRTADLNFEDVCVSRIGQDGTDDILGMIGNHADVEKNLCY